VTVSLADELSSVELSCNSEQEVIDRPFTWRRPRC